METLNKETDAGVGWGITTMSTNLNLKTNEKLTRRVQSQIQDDKE